MTIREVTGNIFDLNVDAIGHGVNCVGVMGAGIAASFRDRHQGMYEDYCGICRRGQLDIGQVFVWHTGQNAVKIVYNMATQFHPGPNAELDAIEVSLQYVRYHAERYNLKSV